MNKFSTLQPYFPENQDERKRINASVKPMRRLRNTGKPSTLALRNILGFAAACNFQKTEHQGTLEILIN
ncbi:MAG TPA: hypothetical protein PKE03_10720 [Bacteroidales bacterium]|nr:hypothetical protein [Bacteroidales bacterium]